MIRAAHITDSASRRAGGMFESVKGLCATLNVGGHVRAELFAGEDEFTRVDRESWNGVPLHIARSAAAGVGQSFTMFCDLNASSFDIAHLHGIWGPASRSMALWRTLNRKRCYIISPRGMLEPWALRSGSRLKKNIGWALWQASLLRQATCIHALCQPEAVSIANMKLGRPICVIPNGVHLPEVSAMSPPAANTLLFLGRIHPKKGLAELLTAFARIEPAQRYGWRLTIAGWDDGGHLSVLRQLAKRLDVEDSVEFAGPVFGAEKDRLFRRSTAFALPSHSEGLPMAVLEAWSYRRPAIISRECHLDVGFDRRAAIEVAPTVESIEQGLRTLFTLPSAALATMGENGFRLVAEKFSWGAVADQFTLVYEWMLGGRKPACVV